MTPKEPASNVSQSDLVYNLTNQTNYMERINLEAMVVDIDKKVNTFCENQMLISMFAWARYRYLFYTERISTHNDTNFLEVSF